MKLFRCRRTPRVLRGGISGSVEFISFRKTPRKSRLGLASPAMLCECAMEPLGGYDSHLATLLHAHFEAPATTVRTEPDLAKWASGKWAGTIFRGRAVPGYAVKRLPCQYDMCRGKTKRGLYLW